MALVYGCDPSDILNIDPTQPDPPRLVYDRLRSADRAVQERALAILDAPQTVRIAAITKAFMAITPVREIAPEIVGMPSSK